jgi:hypothetical protein
MWVPRAVFCRRCAGARSSCPSSRSRSSWIHGLQLAQARRCALIQRRPSQRLGENGAWLVATAESIDADVIAADRRAFARLGARYLRFR